MSKAKRKPIQDPAVTCPTQSPGFDVGFQLPEQCNLENGLGNVAINTETLHESLQSQVETALGQLDGSTKTLQSVLADQLHSNLSQIQQNTNNLQHSLEVAFSGQLGKLMENTATIAPNHPDMKVLLGTDSIDNSGKPVAHIQSTTSQQFAGGGVIPPSNFQKIVQIACNNAMASLSQGKWPSGFDPSVLSNGCAYSAELELQDPMSGRLFRATVSANKDDVSVITNSSPMGPSVAVHCGPPNPNWILPDSAPQVTWGSATCTGSIGTETQKPPPCPPQPCPVKMDINWPDCIKVKSCDEDKPKPCKYCIYCTNEGVMYVQRDTDSPKKPTDKKLFCGDILEANLQALIQQCTKQTSSDTDTTEFAYGPPNTNDLTGCDNLFNYQSLTAPLAPDYFRKLFVSWDEQFPTPTNTGLAVVDNAVKQFWTNAAGLLGAVVDSMMTTDLYSNLLGCKGGLQNYGVIAARIVNNIFKIVGGDTAKPTDVSLGYAQNTACPYLIPSSEISTAAFLTDSMSLDRLKCIVAANGNRWDSWSQIVDSQRTRLNAAETLMLWRRKEITLEERNNRLRQLGYLNQSDYAGLEKLTEQVPPISDLISMMIRDVEDTVNVDWRESDAIFKDKWKGQLQTWGYNQGIPEDYAKYAWRAHWVIPSPGQLATFWQRLRFTGQFGTEAEFKKLIKGALTQQDILPFWQDAYLETQFHPLSRVDSKRAFAVGAIDEKQLRHAFTDAGYSDGNADILVDFTRKQLIEQYKRSPILNKYAEGIISIGELDLELTDLGLERNVIDSILAYAKKLSLRKTRGVCIKAIRKRFLLGELKYNEMKDSLLDQGLDPDQANNIAQGFKCEQVSKSKFVPASVLCGWYERGVIDEVEMYTRLRNIGFNEDDATKMIRDCMIRNGIKLDKETQTQLAKAQRQALREARLQKQLAKELQHSLDVASQRQTKAIHQRETRQKMLVNLAELWSKKTNTPLADSVAGFDTIIKKIVNANIAPINLVYSAAVNAAKDPNLITLDQAAEEMTELLLSVDSP